MIDTLNVQEIDTLSAVAVRVVELADNSSFCSFTLNEILTLLLTVGAFAVAICQFRNEMKKNRQEAVEVIKAQKEERRREWLLSVIIHPQIEAINHFYKEFIDKVCDDVYRLRRERRVQGMWLAMQARINADRQEQIHAFFDHLDPLIQPFDEQLSEKIKDEVMELEDMTLKLIERYIKRDEPLYEIRRLLLLNKVNIVQLLYNKTQESDN